MRNCNRYKDISIGKKIRDSLYVTLPTDMNHSYISSQYGLCDLVSSIGVRILAGGLMTIHRSRTNEKPHIFSEKLFNNTFSQ